MNISFPAIVRIVRSYRKLSSVADMFSKVISNGHRTVLDDVAWDLETILVLSDGDTESDLCDSAVHKLLSDPSVSDESVAQRITH